MRYTMTNINSASFDLLVFQVPYSQTSMYRFLVKFVVFWNAEIKIVTKISLSNVSESFSNVIT